MIRQNFFVECADWKVTVFYEATEDDSDEIYKELTRVGISRRNINRAMRNLNSGNMNNGFTFTNPKTKESVIVIGTTTTANEFANTYSHEKGHLVRHISQTLGIDPYGEDEQYIHGELSSKMFKVGKRFLCDCCRNNTKYISTFFRVFRI